MTEAVCAALRFAFAFSAGLVEGSENPETARELIACLGSPEAAPVIEKTGLEPISAN